MRDPNCDKCPLHVKATHICMAGRWWNKMAPATPRPLVAFVGQAPCREDDLKAMPFVGPAGQVLQQAIDEYKLQPAFVTNLVRCFPGTNARGKDIPPTAGQIAACKPYLDAELKKLNPKYIVAVGGHALQALTGRTGITTWAGQVAGKWNGIPVFGMLHPSYILAKPKELPRFEAHAKTLSELVRPGTAKAHPPVEELNLWQAKDRLQRAKGAVAWDIETSTKWPWEEGARIRTVAFADDEFTPFWVNLEKRGGPGEEFLTWFLNFDIPKVGHNLAFESLWSLWLYGIMPKNWAEDTYLRAHLVDENQPKGLDMLASKYLGAPAYDIAPLMLANGWDYGTVPVKDLGPYNALDAAYTFQLIEPLTLASPAGHSFVYEQILIPLAKLCARMTFRGMHVDLKWAAQVEKKYAAEMVALDKKIRATPEVQKLEKGLKKGQVLNYRSPMQMQKLLFGLLKIPIGPTTDSGAPSTDAKYLERLKNPPALLSHYLDWKTRETMIGKFVHKFPLYADGDSIIHAPISAALQVTGRTTANDPPLYGTPKGVRVNGKYDMLPRGMFDSRFKGGKIVNADYKALEFRLVCSEAEEWDFIEAFKKGMDPHAITAKDLFGVKWQPAERDKAKVVNFSIIYGVTEYSLAPKLGETEEAALRIIIRFKKTHPKIFIWMERQYERVRRERIAVNRFGRVRHLPDITHMKEWQQREILREAGNFPIQSLGADITNLSCIEVDRRLRAEGAESKLILNYHDAIYVDTHPDEVELVQGLLVKVMKDEVPGKLKWLKLPLDVDVKVEDRWGGAKWPVIA